MPSGISEFMRCCHKGCFLPAPQDHKAPHPPSAHTAQPGPPGARPMVRSTPVHLFGLLVALLMVFHFLCDEQSCLGSQRVLTGPWPATPGRVPWWTDRGFSPSQPLSSLPTPQSEQPLAPASRSAQLQTHARTPILGASACMSLGVSDVMCPKWSSALQPPTPASPQQ